MATATGETKAVDVEVSVEGPDPNTIKVRCLTWNVGNTKPDFTELKYTLDLEELKNFDLLVVGTQENHYKNQTLKLGHTASRLDVGSMHEIDTEGGQAKDATPTGVTNFEDMAEVVEVEAEGESEDGRADSPAPNGEGSPRTTPDKHKPTKSVELRQETLLNNEWEVEICKHMGDEWSILERAAFGEMKLFIMIHTGSDEGSAWATHNVATGLGKGTSATGIGGVGNNKGGIAISFHLRNTYMSFISAHLNAHLEHEKRRNSDHCEIRRETQNVGNGALDVCEEVDHCVWIGDLNYRCDIDRNELDKKKHHTKEENWATVKQMIDDKEYAKLLEIDQLNQSIKEGLAWYRFEEGAIDFAPTFKVLKKEPGPGHYKKQRVPSYCDRVLFKSSPHLKGHVEVKKYVSCPDVSTSDHKPVVADLFIRTSTPPTDVYSFNVGGRRKQRRTSVQGRWWWWW